MIDLTRHRSRSAASTPGCSDSNQAGAIHDGAVIQTPSVVIDRIDHLVLTVADIDETMDFYTSVLGMEPVTFGAGRRALSFGCHKLNLHQAGHEFEPKAARPTPDSIDYA